MLPLDSQIKDSADILKALGQLALAASQAEAYAAQGLYYVLTDTPGNEEGAARIAAEFRSFNSLHRLLTIALRCDTPLSGILEAARNDAEKRDAHGDLQLVAVLAGVASTIGDGGYLAEYASENPQATAIDYINKVKVLYDKRNECLHSLGIEVIEDRAHLYKRKKDGAKTIISAQSLMEPCIRLRYYPGITTLASAVEAVSLELGMASIDLVMLPVTVQWFRRRGTPLDFAPLVDHYVALATQPSDQQLASLKKAETILTIKLAAYRAANPNADVTNTKP
jgi:hypothetical protein